MCSMDFRYICTILGKTVFVDTLYIFQGSESDPSPIGSDRIRTRIRTPLN